MLVLTRKPTPKQQTINVGDDIKVHVLEIDRNQVKIGIDAPPSIVIWRGEIDRLDSRGDK